MLFYSNDMSPKEEYDACLVRAMQRRKIVRKELERLCHQSEQMGEWLAVVAARLKTHPSYLVENDQGTLVFRTRDTIHLLVDTDEVTPMPHPPADDIASLLNTIAVLGEELRDLNDMLEP